MRRISKLEKFRGDWDEQEALAREMFLDIKNRDKELQLKSHYENPVLDVLYRMLGLYDDRTDKEFLGEDESIEIFDRIQELVEEFVDNFEIADA